MGCCVSAFEGCVLSGGLAIKVEKARDGWKDGRRAIFFLGRRSALRSLAGHRARLDASHVH